METRRALILLIFGLLAASAGVSRCASGAPPAVAPPRFETAVRPLLEAKCFRCHGAKTRKGELSLHTTAGILQGGESGPVIVPGKSGDSRLYQLIQQGEMPPEKKDPLSPAELEIIRRWIDGGADLGGNNTANQPPVTQHDVLPIFLLRCTVCHGRQVRESDLDLRSRAAMLRGGKSGPAILLGKPEESLLVKRVRAEEMPPHKRLVEAAVKPMERDELEKIVLWIAGGAAEAPEAVDHAGTPQDPLIHSQDKDFWAFRTPQWPTIPMLARRDIAHAPIDAFVLEKLAPLHLSLSPEADRPTLLRRAALDLTGLPAEPDEAERFLTDPAPDAYDRLIDRLIASPRYGERWGRHWLDVAGYADCEGRREQHLPRPEAWRYRDYVIRAFNGDKPFDRFLLEQLAGDELADYENAATITQELADNLAATAFLRLAPDPTWANLTGFVPDRLEVMADSLDVLGSGVMGLTLKCARCHTHKFDPIPHRDYYRLVAIFKGAYDEHDWLKPEINSFGGALSAGLGERYLPLATSAERRLQENHQAQLTALKAGPKTPPVEKQIAILEASKKTPPRIMALWDRGGPSPTYIYRRGNYLTPGAFVTPGAPAVLCDPARPFTIQPPYPGAKSTGRRLALARWLVHPDQPLTARVMVNRLWKHHYGAGIVRSLGNFGKTGDPPTHPELLDFLAREFIRQGWSVKALQRKMLLAGVYRQRSAVSPESAAGDPPNRLLSRINLRRLEAEVLRDTLLLAAGELDETPFGPAEPVQVRPDGMVVSGKRRSVYVQQLRKHPPSLLESFDLPTMNPNCLQRDNSLVATQALYLQNDAAIRNLAEKCAEQVLLAVGDDSARQIQQSYRRILGRAPLPEELAACQEKLTELKQAWTAEPQSAGKLTPPEAARRALATVCHAVMNSASFLYVD